MASERALRYGLAALMIGAGVTHLVAPRFYDEIVPTWVPIRARTTTYLSGIAELASGALLLTDRTARAGGWCTFAVLVGVYPANLQMVVDAGRPSSTADWVVWLRAPLQFPLLAWALQHARGRRLTTTRTASA